MITMQIEQMPLMRPVPMDDKDGEIRKWRIESDPYWFWADPEDSYVSYGIPKGFIFDGASIPQVFWNLLSPTGYLFLAGLIHDFSYRYEKIITKSFNEKYGFGEPYTEFVNKDQADDIFEYVAHRISPDNVNWTSISRFLLGFGGHRIWNKHRDNNLKYSIGDILI